MSDIKPPSVVVIPAPPQRVNPSSDVTVALNQAQNACRAWAPTEARPGDVVASTQAQLCNWVINPMPDIMMEWLVMFAFIGCVALAYLAVRFIAVACSGCIRLARWMFGYSEKHVL